MSKGGYNGGSTILRPGSDWFGQAKGNPKKKKPSSRGLRMSHEEKVAQKQYLIELAAERLAHSQETFDEGEKPKSVVKRDSFPSKRRKKHKSMSQ